jgi:hypothetical protein
MNRDKWIPFWSGRSRAEISCVVKWSYVVVVAVVVQPDRPFASLPVQVRGLGVKFDNALLESSAVDVRPDGPGCAEGGKVGKKMPTVFKPRY